MNSNINSLRVNYNKNMSKRRMFGMTKREAWSASRRQTAI